MKTYYWGKKPSGAGQQSRGKSQEGNARQQRQADRQVGTQRKFGRLDLPTIPARSSQLGIAALRSDGNSQSTNPSSNVSDNFGKEQTNFQTPPSAEDSVLGIAEDKGSTEEGAPTSVSATDTQQMDRAAIEARLRQIADVLYGATLSILERDEHVAEYVMLVDRVSGQLVQKPLGGRPEGGLAKAARELPVSGKTVEARRKFIERATKVAGIALEAKAFVRESRLANNRAALLQIAKEATPAAQLEKARRLLAPPRRGSVPSAEVEADLGLKHQNPQCELSTAQEVSATAPTTPLMHLPDFPELPAFLDRRVPAAASVRNDATLAALQTAWDGAPEFRHAWANAPAIVREHFIAMVLRHD